MQTQLKAILQNKTSATNLENLAAALIGRMLGVTIAVAKSGFQHGGDAGPSNRQGRRFRIECKKYGDNTALSDRELLGEIDQAISRDNALEAWILVATRNVPEQLEQSLSQKGESVGVPVIIIDWKSNETSALAALCASAPDLVECIISIEAGKLSEALQPTSIEAIERLRRDLQAWSLGFETLRKQSQTNLEKIWQSPRYSNAALGQNVAGGAEDQKIRRRTVHDALDSWWEGPAKCDAPAAVVGRDGVGKTWATLDWLIEQHDSLPIVLVIPSSAAAGLATASETGIKRFLADRLYELTGVRDCEHWLHRFDRLLMRPIEEGPVLAILFDGLNQEPSVSWLPLLKLFQAEPFAGRIRVLISTRTHHYEVKLNKLRGLIVPAIMIPVDNYDTNPGGEFDQMLSYAGLTQQDLHPDLIELACIPRLFRLVIKFRDRLIESGQVTIHRLLWEYGRDSFGNRSGRSFSEEEWRAWLHDIALRHLDGIREYSLKTLGESTNRPDLTESEVYARMSDIIDGQFTLPDRSGNLKFKPDIVAHALGAALLSELDASDEKTFNKVLVELDKWLDPITGLDERAEILRASVSILIERSKETETPIASALVTAWLQTQNVTEAHRRELASLSTELIDALLDTIEHSVARTHASARLWAVNALRAITRTNLDAMAKIVQRTSQWFSIVSRDIRPQDRTSSEIDKSRSEHLIKRIGIDTPGTHRILNRDIRLVDWDAGVLAATSPSILEGFPLANAMPTFEAAAICLAIRGHMEGWDGLKWLCLLNEVDPDDTAEALRKSSLGVAKYVPETGINPLLPARVAAILLWLTGREEDETSAVAIDPGLDRLFTYTKDYLPQPSHSLFALERRHADEALNDTGLSIHSRIERTRELWLDPDFTPPPTFVKELSEVIKLTDVNKLDRHSGPTIEDHFFEEIEPALARCAPDLLADLIRRKMQSYSNCPPESRYWAAVRSNEHHILAGKSEGAAARMLRIRAKESTDNHEAYAAGQLVIMELCDQTAMEQANTIINAGLSPLLTDFSEMLQQLSPDEADALITRFGNGKTTEKRDLIIVLSQQSPDFTLSVKTWLFSVAFGPDSELHGLAFRALTRINAADFGRELHLRNWAWSSKQDDWVNHYGSDALIEGTLEQPFDQVATSLAPWRLLEAAIRRGAAPSEVRLAASIFGHVLKADHLQAPDTGSTLSVDISEAGRDPFTISVTPCEPDHAEEDQFTALQAAMDIETQQKIHQRATETAALRIRDARESGATLYLSNIDTDDVAVVLAHAPDIVDKWLEGMSEYTIDFRRRVQLAEAAYIALCEALLNHRTPDGVTLWRALRKTVTTRYIGAAGVDELIHIAFRAPDTSETAELRSELIGLNLCHTDKDLLNIAIAACFNGKSDWLSMIIEEDKASSLSWRHKRGTVLEGFTSHNKSPIADAWPDYELRTGHEVLRRKSALFRFREACAHHWWRVYLTCEDAVQAYAAWVLFLRSADRRAWIWIVNDIQAIERSMPLYKLKMRHMHLNRSHLQRAMKKHEEKLDKHFLNRKIVDGIEPWGIEPA